MKTPATHQRPMPPNAAGHAAAAMRPPICPHLLTARRLATLRPACPREAGMRLAARRPRPPSAWPWPADNLSPPAACAHPSTAAAHGPPRGLSAASFARHVRGRWPAIPGSPARPPPAAGLCLRSGRAPAPRRPSAKLSRGGRGEPAPHALRVCRCRGTAFNSWSETLEPTVLPTLLTTFFRTGVRRPPAGISPAEPGGVDGFIMGGTRTRERTRSSGAPGGRRALCPNRLVTSRRKAQNASAHDAGAAMRASAHTCSDERSHTSAPSPPISGMSFRCVMLISGAPKQCFASRNTRASAHPMMRQRQPTSVHTRFVCPRGGPRHKRQNAKCCLWVSFFTNHRRAFKSYPAI